MTPCSSTSIAALGSTFLVLLIAGEVLRPSDPSHPPTSIEAHQSAPAPTQAAAAAGRPMTVTEAAAKGVTSSAPVRSRDCSLAASSGGFSTGRAVPAAMPAQAGAPRGCIIGPADGDFEHIAARLRNVAGPGLALARYADGELLILRGQRMKNVDQYTVEAGTYPKLQAALLASLRGHFGEEYYYGFPGPDLDPEGAPWMLAQTEQTCGFVTFANIWVNSHLERTALLFNDLAVLYDQRIVLAINAHSLTTVRTSVIGRAAIDELPIDPVAVERWEDDAFRVPLIARARELAANYDGNLFIVAAGALSNILIAEMWEVNCKNRYVDFGSTVDNLLAGKQTRNYPREYTDPDFALTRAAGMLQVQMD